MIGATSADDDVFVERRPIERLAPFVAAVWVHRVGAADGPVEQLAIPHGGADVTCVVGSAPTVTGPRTRPSTRTVAPGAAIIGVRFDPAAPFGAGPELVDTTVTAGDLWGSAVDEVTDAIGGADDPWSALGHLQSWLASMIDLDRPRDPLVERFVAACTAGAVTDVTSARRRLGLSERHLRRRCQQAVGVSPGSVLRQLRFQRFIALAQRRVAAGGIDSGRDLAGMAATCGYADHAHLARECRRLTGETPSAYLDGMVAGCGPAHDHRASFARFPFATDGRSVQAGAPS